METPYGRLTVFADGANASSRRHDQRAESGLSFLRTLVEGGATVVDVGAYVGAHTLAFSRFVGSDGLVVAIEPQVRPFGLLARNIEANGLTNVRAENANVSSAAAEAILAGEPGGGAARTTNLDALGIADCALIRINLDGEEDSVLRGARDTLRRSTPVVYAECNSLGRGLKSLGALKDLGYRVLAHVGSFYDPAAFPRRGPLAFGSVALVGVAGPHIERIERHQSRPNELLLDIDTADDLVLALFGPQPDAARRLVPGRRQTPEEQQERVVRLEKALADTERLVAERANENIDLQDKLDRVHAVLAETQKLAIERAKQIEALHKRVDYDEAVSFERQAILESLQLETELRVPIKETLEAIESGARNAATVDDVVQCYRRILRRDIEGDAEARAQLSDGPSMRDLIRKLVHAVEFDAAGPLAKDVFDQREYLAANLTHEARCKCFVHHYDFLTKTVSDSALKLLLRNGVTLYESRPANVEYSILMHNPRRGAYEGELSLFFVASGEAIFVMSFAIVPGSVVGLEDEPVILIARMQGQTRSPMEIRQAAKDNSDVVPQAILFAALRGVAQAIGVKHIAGVQATNLVAYEEAKAQILENAYDKFYASVGAAGPHNGFYIWSASTPEKPLNQVKPGHRLRTKAKRAFKLMIANHIALAWPILFDPAHEFPALNGRKGEVAILRNRTNALRAELNRFTGAAAQSIFESINKTLARLVSRRTRSLRLARLVMTRKAFERRLVKNGMFDENWYLATYSDVAAAGLDPIEHYFQSGAAERRDPSPVFSTAHYLSENPDVAQAGVNPLVHYCLYGAQEKRVAAHRLRPAGSLKPPSAAPPPLQAEKPLSDLV